jgi:hypothetical protein
MATVNQSFQSAPMGRRIVATTILSLAVIFVMFVANLAIAARMLPMHSAAKAGGIVALAPPAVLLVVMLVGISAFFFERSRVSQFRIEENCLVLGRKRFPLGGLAGVARDDAVLHRAIKVWGNGGLGSVRGSFRSKRLGKFYAFMTDAEKAVVLRWPDKVVAVSPVDPEFFIFTVRSAAGLR